MPEIIYKHKLPGHIPINQLEEYARRVEKEFHIAPGSGIAKFIIEGYAVYVQVITPNMDPSNPQGMFDWGVRYEACLNNVDNSFRK